MAVLLPLLLAMAPAMAQTVVHKGQITSLNVKSVQGHTYEWELYNDSTVDFAKVSGYCPVKSAKFISGNTDADVYVQWLEIGRYFFKVTARDGAKCVMNLKMGIIQVIPPVIEAVAAGAGITGACQQLNLDASKSIGNITKYQWSVLDQGGILTSQTGINTTFQFSPSYSGSLPADFRVKLQVTDDKGNTDKDTVIIKVDSQPVADIYSNGQLQKDGSMIIDGGLSIGTGLSYHWYTNEGNIIGDSHQSKVDVNGPGIYFLEITDIHGCQSLKSFRFPLVSNVLVANPDYARTSWDKDVRISVLDNDTDTDNDIDPGSVHIINLPSRGTAVVNKDGTVTYSTKINKPGNDSFIYGVCDSVGVCDSAKVTIDIYDAGVKLIEGFSPNGDGQNDQLVFKGLENYPKSRLYVFTRSGQLVYQSQDYLNDWDGRTIKSSLTNKEIVPPGTYYYVLELGGTTRTIKGFVYIGY